MLPTETLGRLMTRGSLVIFQDGDDKRLWVSGVVIKGPYGSVLKTAVMDYSHERRVVDVLFGTEVIEKIPVARLKVVK